MGEVVPAREYRSGPAVDAIHRARQGDETVEQRLIRRSHGAESRCWIARATPALFPEFHDPSGEDDIGYDVSSSAAITRGTREIVVFGSRFDIDDPIGPQLQGTILK